MVELEVLAEEMAAGRVAVKNDCIAVYLVASPVLLAHAAAAAAHEIVDLNLAAHAHAHDLLRQPAQLALRGAIWRDSASAAAPPRATPSHLSTARSGQSSAGVGGRRQPPILEGEHERAHVDGLPHVIV